MPIYYGKAEGGKLPFMRFAKPYIEAMEGKQLKITIEPYKPTRSNQQNRFYQKVVISAIQGIMRDIGQPLSAKLTHELIYRHILGRTKLVEVDGKMLELRESSTKVPTDEWEKDIEIIRAWAADKGVVIPFPNEYD